MKGLTKDLKEVIQNATWQEKLHNEREIKLKSMDGTTHKKFIG